MVTRSEADGVRIFLLGGFRVFVGPHQIDDGAWRLRKARSLIKLLALTPGHRLHREQMVTLLWPDLPPESAANNLHQVMHLARRALEVPLPNGQGSIHLTIRDQVVVLKPSGPLLWVDVEVFEEAAERASRTSTVRACEDAIRRYTGELLPEDRYEEWTIARREMLTQRCLRLLVDLATVYGQDGKKPEAVEMLRKAVALEPAHESAHAGLMRLYALMGQREAALRQYHDLQAALKDIDAEPQPSTFELNKAIQSGDLAKLTSPPATHERRAERRHTRLLRAARTAKPERLGNLPAPLGTFIGRVRDLETLKNLLVENRLLTLTGPGGSGKTRLGLELAAAVSDRFPDGTWWVDLQALQEHSQVAQTVAATLGIREQPGVPLETVLAGGLRGRRLMLVLDNCEHLLAGCSALAEALVGACPELTILSASRERLGVSGEARWPVRSLTLPPKDTQVPLEELYAFEAVRLFEIRSRAVNPGFTLNAGNAESVAEICRRLDGLPLAIELAAARTHALSPAQVLQRLADASALMEMSGKSSTRYSTLAGAIDWSHRILNDSERALFRRLAVFRGGFTLEAVQAVCADPPVGVHGVLDLLFRLVDKSLVTVEESQDGNVRYGFLETIREYAQDRLVSEGEEATVRERHLDWCLTVAEPLAEFESVNPAPQTIVAVSAAVAREHENIRAAIDWSQRRGAAEDSLRLVYAMSIFWLPHGQVREGCARLGAVLRETGSGSSLLRAKTLRKLGRFTYVLGDSAAATRLIEEALACFRELGEHYECGRCLSNLASIARLQGNYSRAMSLCQESRTIFSDLGAKVGLAAMLPLLGGIYQAQGDYRAAEACIREAIVLSREVDLGYLLPDALWSLANLYLRTGHPEVARSLFEESLDRAHSANVRVPIPAALTSLACIAQGDGDFSKAHGLLEEALSIARETGWKWQVNDVFGQIAILARVEGRVQEASAVLESSLLELQGTGERLRIIFHLDQSAQVAAQKGEYERACHLFGAVERLREDMGVVMAPADRPGFERDVSMARTSLGEVEIARVWAQGRGMTMDEAVDYALQSGPESQERNSQRGALA